MPTYVICMNLVGEAVHQQGGGARKDQAAHASYQGKADNPGEEWYMELKTSTAKVHYPVFGFYLDFKTFFLDFAV